MINLLELFLSADINIGFFTTLTCLFWNEELKFLRPSRSKFHVLIFRLDDTCVRADETKYHFILLKRVLVFLLINTILSNYAYHLHYFINCWLLGVKLQQESFYSFFSNCIDAMNSRLRNATLSAHYRYRNFLRIIFNCFQSINISLFSSRVVWSVN